MHFLQNNLMCFYKNNNDDIFIPTERDAVEFFDDSFNRFLTFHGEAGIAVMFYYLAVFKYSRHTVSNAHLLYHSHKPF